MHIVDDLNHEHHRAAELVTSDLLCCPAPTQHNYYDPPRFPSVGDVVRTRTGKRGTVTYIDPRNDDYLVQWSYPDFGAHWYRPGDEDA